MILKRRMHIRLALESQLSQLHEWICCCEKGMAASARLAAPLAAMYQLTSSLPQGSPSPAGSCRSEDRDLPNSVLEMLKKT